MSAPAGSRFERRSLMISKRIGHWSWSLSADERKTAAVVACRLREQTSLATRLRRKHDAMLEKQRKLDDLETRLEQQGVSPIGRSRLRFRRSTGWTAAGTPPA
jgi:hypothetical protein